MIRKYIIKNLCDFDFIDECTIIKYSDDMLKAEFKGSLHIGDDNYLIGFSLSSIKEKIRAELVNYGEPDIIWIDLKE